MYRCFAISTTALERRNLDMKSVYRKVYCVPILKAVLSARNSLNIALVINY